ncbi:PREDICTED: glycine receptor subunit alpha-1-like [Branchiostoma belcheri]|uniref:Glycine receptor subunit alpha-1-like n=1 Tax=Branchiostoma belcheri TaxID=7741 RepID=A0A6P5AEL8_BRABE|nr:PREDICTED: glycine receptor subunit alpha-1-like [Branchiostoma belcheri]
MMSLAEVDIVQLHPTLLTPAGHVIVRHEVDAKVHCLMDLHAYPMDTQTCRLFIHLGGNLRFRWGVPPALDRGFAKSAVILRLPGVHSQLRLEVLEMLAYTNSYLEKATDIHTFTTGEMRFTLVRRLRYHLLQTYMPCFFIVFMGWINFWLDMDSPPARVSLGVTTVLTIITQSAQTSRIPEVSYIRAVDIWVSVCQLFVFSALVEYAVISYIKRWKHLKKVLKPTSPSSTNESNSTDSRQQPNTTDSRLQPNSTTDSGQQPTAKRQRSGRYYAEAIERVARIAYPIAFLVFMVIYVSVYYNFRI